jgi:hypothetical protein
MQNRNIIVTGVQRGGTTLSSFLINQLSDCICLDEPMDFSQFSSSNMDYNLESVERFFQEQRKSIIHRGIAISKSIDGVAFSNPLSDEVDKMTRRRVTLVNSKELRIEKQTGVDHILAIKHPACFTALLGYLVKKYVCLVVIRNPLAVLLSWQNAHQSVFDGRAPAAERVIPGLSDHLSTIEDRYQRQIELLSWYFGQFKLAPPSSILKYEDLIAQKGAQLPAMVGSKDTLNYELKSRNLREPDREKRNFLAGKLLKQGGHFLDFYSRDDILKLAAGDI